MIVEWIRFGLVAFCMLAGVFTLFVSILGIYRFDFALNRIHAAAMADTLALFLFFLGLMFAVGFHSVLWKFALVLLIQWSTSPLSSHMLTQFEYKVDENLSSHVELPECPEEDEL